MLASVFFSLLSLNVAGQRQGLPCQLELKHVLWPDQRTEAAAVECHAGGCVFSSTTVERRRVETGPAFSTWTETIAVARLTHESQATAK